MAVVVRARTGPVGAHSTAGMTVIAATGGAAPDFQKVVAQGGAQFLRCPAGAFPVVEERSGGGLRHAPRLPGPTGRAVRYHLPE